MIVSPLAHVHQDARIGEESSVEPFAVIESDVQMGSNCWVGAHAVIMSGTIIGDHTRIFPGSVIGGDPQDLKYQGERSLLRIGSEVTIREFCTINRGTAETGSTDIGDHSLLMAYVHVAHDCKIGSSVVISNGVNLAGHVRIDSYAVLGGMSAVQQFVRIGRHCFIGGGTLVRKDVPPYVRAAREPLSYIGVNVIGMRRRGIEESRIERIQDLYRILFVKHSNIKKALGILKKKYSGDGDAQYITNFIQESSSGIIRGYQKDR